MKQFLQRLFRIGPNIVDVLTLELGLRDRQIMALIDERESLRSEVRRLKIQSNKHWRDMGGVGPAPEDV